MEFIDRNTQYPGRVRLEPVAGSDNLYDLTLAEGEITGDYTEGTPLSADVLNAMYNELKINSIQISDGTHNGIKFTIGAEKDLLIRLPSTISANLNGTANTAKELNQKYGSVTMKTLFLSTSYTTVYSSKNYSSCLVIISPQSSSAVNTAIFAISYAGGSTKIDDVTYINKTGFINKRWDGLNFQVAMSNASAAGTYAITIIDAHY